MWGLLRFRGAVACFDFLEFGCLVWICAEIPTGWPAVLGFGLVGGFAICNNIALDLWCIAARMGLGLGGLCRFWYLCVVRMSWVCRVFGVLLCGLRFSRF